MDRPSMNDVYCSFANIVAQRSVCQRRTQVGCVITNWEKTNVVAIGYNGPARGLPHDCRPNFPPDTFDEAAESSRLGFTPAIVPGSCTCVHAEANALIKAPYDMGDLRMYTTLSPCEQCARMILNSRVREVVFINMYRKVEGLHVLARGDVLFWSQEEINQVELDPTNDRPFTFPNGETFYRNFYKGVS